MIRSRFCIHTGHMATVHVASRLRKTGFFDVIEGPEYVHATIFYHYEESLKSRLKASLGYVPSRFVEYDRRPAYPSKPQEPNNDDEDDGN